MHDVRQNVNGPAAVLHGEGFPQDYKGCHAVHQCSGTMHRRADEVGEVFAAQASGPWHCKFRMIDGVKHYAQSSFSTSGRAKSRHATCLPVTGTISILAGEMLLVT